MENRVVDILEYAQKGEEVPHGSSYQVRIDGKMFTIHTGDPTGEALLKEVGKRACAFELIKEFIDGRNDVVESEERVDLRKKGLKGFITAHKEIVTISINDKPHKIERGDRTVAEILRAVGETTDGYVLLEEKNGPPMPVAPDRGVKIEGCEVFHTQPQSGGSS